MNCICTVDIGSNSVRYLVARSSKTAASGIEVVRFNRHTTRLLGRVQKDGMRFTADCVDWITGILAQIKADAESLGAQEFFVAGAHVLRTVENPQMLKYRVKTELGFEIKTLSGQREGELACAGAVSSLGLDPRGCTVIDVGGGSTEIIRISTDLKCDVVSVPVGAVNCTPWFGNLRARVPVSELEKVLKVIEDKVQTRLAEVLLSDVTKVVAVGGSASTLERILDALDIDKSQAPQGSVCREWIDFALDELCGVDFARRCELFGLEEQRADIIIAGLCVWKFLLRHFDIESVKVSFHGVCMGLAGEYFGHIF